MKIHNTLTNQLQQSIHHGLSRLDGKTSSGAALLRKYGSFYLSLLKHENLCDQKSIFASSMFCKLVDDFENLESILQHESSRENEKLIEKTWLQEHHKSFQLVCVNLLYICTMATLDLSCRLKVINSVSQADSDSTKYVIGMIEVTSINMTALITDEKLFQCTDFNDVSKFFEDSINLISSLKASKLGSSESVI